MKPFVFFSDDGIAWFRVFGYGLHFKDRRRRPLLFSERTGLVRVWRVGPWSIKTLGRVKP